MESMAEETRQPMPPGPAERGRSEWSYISRGSLLGSSWKAAGGAGGNISTSAPNSLRKHLVGEEMEMQMVLSPLDEDGVGEAQPE